MDHTGENFPQVRKAAENAWNEMLTLHPPPHTAYGRIDIRLDAPQIPYVIDINPNAYLRENGNLYSCWASLGGNYTRLILNLIKRFHKP
jgi:D-alanine-D-alanine ligase-like ATP-grasp enzyme